MVASKIVLPKGGDHDKRQHTRIHQGSERAISSGIEESIEGKILSKMNARPNWKKRVNYSVIVAHDFPQGELYQAFGMKWYEWLVQAASNVDVLQAFDEFWLVTMQELKGKAQRVCGKELSPYLGQG
jgi:hypothetical protein